MGRAKEVSERRRNLQIVICFQRVYDINKSGESEHILQTAVCFGMRLPVYKILPGSASPRLNARAIPTVSPKH